MNYMYYGYGGEILCNNHALHKGTLLIPFSSLEVQ
jgi:hypothetical protein